MGTLTELSLFSGYGGFTLGLRLAGIPLHTICYVEIEQYCQRIIKARIQDGLLDDAPIWDDVKTFDGTRWTGCVDILTAGFPCQPHSVAGQRKGARDGRNLWPDTIRIIGEVGPSFVLLENVPGILSNGYAGTVIGQLAERGYDCMWGLLSATAIGAPHLRRRWWCVAHSKGQSGYIRLGGEGEITSEQVQTGRFRRCPFPPPPNDGEAWRETLEYESELEPALRGMVDGAPHRVDRLKALGNGIVPAVVAEFLRRIAQ